MGKKTGRQNGRADYPLRNGGYLDFLGAGSKDAAIDERQRDDGCDDDEDDKNLFEIHSSKFADVGSIGGPGKDARPDLLVTGKIAQRGSTDGEKRPNTKNQQIGRKNDRN